MATVQNVKYSEELLFKSRQSIRVLWKAGLYISTMVVIEIDRIPKENGAAHALRLSHGALMCLKPRGTFLSHCFHTSECFAGRKSLQMMKRRAPLGLTDVCETSAAFMFYV